MTKKKQKKWITAEELMAELNSDPDYVQRMAEKEQRHQARAERYAVTERPILDKLKARGFDANSVYDAVHKYAPLPDEFVAELLAGVENSTRSVLRTLPTRCSWKH